MYIAANSLLTLLQFFFILKDKTVFNNFVATALTWFLLKYGDWFSGEGFVSASWLLK